MFGSQMIEVLIGLGFLFFLLSVIVTTVREFIEGLVQTRAVHLERGIRELLRDPDGSQWAKALYAHPQISALFRGEYHPETQLKGAILPARKSITDTTRTTKNAVGATVVTTTVWKRLQLRSNLPAYIPSRNFAVAMLDLTGRREVGGDVSDATAPLSFVQIRAGVALLPNPSLQRAMLVALDDAKGDMDRARANLEAWYDSAMDRVSGWYRKETQTILFTIGLVLAVALNVDTIRVANALSQNQTLRETIVAKAQESVAAARPATGVPEDQRLSVDANAARIDGLKTEIEGLGYPIGWVGPKTFGLSTLAGWLITAFALTLGAPFWFDLLNKLMVIRSTVKPHEKSGEEQSEDRSTRASRAAAAVPDPGAAAAAVSPVPAPLTGPPPDDPALDFVPHEWGDGRPVHEGLL